MVDKHLFGDLGAMARVLSWERNQRCHGADLRHACLVIVDAHRKRTDQPSWPIPQMIEQVLSYLMLPAVVMTPVVAAGDCHTCVIDASGHLHCFGGKRFGKCDVPAELGIVTQVAAGGEHTCVIDASGHLHCFGWNDHRQCDAPAELGIVTQVAAGYSHTCVIDASGHLHCFGWNDYRYRIVNHAGKRSSKVEGIVRSSNGEQLNMKVFIY